MKNEQTVKSDRIFLASIDLSPLLFQSKRLSGSYSYLEFVKRLQVLLGYPWVGEVHDDNKGVDTLTEEGEHLKQK